MTSLPLMLQSLENPSSPAPIGLAGVEKTPTIRPTWQVSNPHLRRLCIDANGSSRSRQMIQKLTDRLRVDR